MGCMHSRPGVSAGVHPVDSIPVNNNNNSVNHHLKDEPILEKHSALPVQKEVNGNRTNNSVESVSDTAMAESGKAQSATPPQRILPVLEKDDAGHLIQQPVPCPEEVEGFMSVQEVYNSMNDGQRSPYLHDPCYMLILDCRDREAFNELHITTARHSSAVDTEYDCLLAQGRLEKFMMVVVYDDASTTQKVEPGLADFVQRLKGANVDVQILRGGFCSFHKLYPFLCNNLTIRSEQDRMRLFKSYPSMVLDGVLCQGNVKHSLDEAILKNLGITHVLNVSTECKNAFPKSFAYLQVAVEDETSAQLEPRLQSATNFVAEAIAGGGRVFVHCVQGKSRSSTCTIAFLMSNMGWTLKDSHDYLKDRRSIAAPNRGFLLQLSKFEKAIFGKILSSVDDLYF
ncbi:dual specificity protein phosphatase 2-like [Diadema antillarum]|uniref:dual specificity protein phosphatase 2-like n=1 Tax=Diadema antillarum TaxID=105358 RepID=UPI003A836D47